MQTSIIQAGYEPVVMQRKSARKMIWQPCWMP